MIVSEGTFPVTPVCDGTNIRVPNYDPRTVIVVRPSKSAGLPALTGNGLNGTGAAAFIASAYWSLTVWRSEHYSERSLTCLGRTYSSVSE